MRKLTGQSKAALVPERLTLYVKPQYHELVEWVQEYTQADSLSEAVFAALADLRALIRERRLQALEQTHGIWKGDPKIRGAFKELEEGWEGWRKQLEGS
jgi:hypothetical protein